jgi:hypothetical protein
MAGMRNMGNVWLGMHRTKLFLGARADDDLSYYEFIGIVKDRINERCNSLREGGSRNTKVFFEQWHDRHEPLLLRHLQLLRCICFFGPKPRT